MIYVLQYAQRLCDRVDRTYATIRKLIESAIPEGGSDSESEYSDDEGTAV